MENKTPDMLGQPTYNFHIISGFLRNWNFFYLFIWMHEKGREAAECSWAQLKQMVVYLIYWVLQRASQGLALEALKLASPKQS